jgi:hypothetical protein
MNTVSMFKMIFMTFCYFVSLQFFAMDLNPEVQGELLQEELDITLKVFPTILKYQKEIGRKEVVERKKR